MTLAALAKHANDLKDIRIEKSRFYTRYCIIGDDGIRRGSGGKVLPPGTNAKYTISKEKEH